MDGKVDSLANIVCILEQGIMRDNKGQKRVPIPWLNDEKQHQFFYCGIC